MGGQAEGDAPPPGCQAARIKSRIKANTDPVDGRANVYGQGYFLSRLHPHQAWVLSYVNRERFRPQCEGSNGNLRYRDLGQVLPMVT
jgi:hypothetical protein